MTGVHRGHRGSFPRGLGAFATLATAAAITERIRVGTFVLANDFRHPANLAKEAATLDLLSDGRLEVGIGAGWLRSEYEATGIPFDSAAVRIDRLAEALLLVKRLWTEDAREGRDQCGSLLLAPGLLTGARSDDHRAMATLPA